MKHLIKKSLFFTLPLFLAACLFDSHDDVEQWNAEVVCPVEGNNIYGMPNRGTFTDERDGNVYRYTTIGNQVWMAENLRYNAPYSMCCNDTGFIRQYCELIEHNCNTEECCKESSCNIFGRYYSIVKNGDRFGPIDRELVDTICPKGWHVPKKSEWITLNNNMRSHDEDGTIVIDRMTSNNSTYFKISTNFPNEKNRMVVGGDACFFSVIPSGFMVSEGDFYESGAFFFDFIENKCR